MANEPRNYVPQRGGMVQGSLKSLDAQQAAGGGAAHNLGGAYSAFGIEYYRATTSATNESTSASIQLQGRIGTTSWHNIGAAITVNATAPAIARSTNSIPVNQVRVNLASFTTSAGAASTAENKIPVTAYVSVGVGSS